MSENYDGNPLSYPTHVRLVQDGELASEAFLALADQDLADRTAFLHAAVGAPLASTTALAALDPSTLADGVVRVVKGVGTYVLDKDPTDIANYGGGGTDRYPRIVDGGADGVWILAAPIYSPTIEPWPMGVKVVSATFTNIDDIVNGLGYAVDAANMFSLPVGFLYNYTATTNQFQSLLFDITDTLVPLYGCKLVSVAVTITPTSGHSALPALRPSLGVWAADNVTPTLAVNHCKAANIIELDQSANVTAYELTHDITYALDQFNVIKAGRQYFAALLLEGNTHAISGTSINAIHLNVSL